MLLLPVLAFVLAPVLIILLPAPLLEALLHKPLYTPVCVSVPIPLLLPTVFLPRLPVLLPTPWLKPLLVVLLLTPVIVPVLPVPFPALVPDLVLLGTFVCACSCPCVVCTLVGLVPVPRLFVTPLFYLGCTCSISTSASIPACTCAVGSPGCAIIYT